MFFLNSLYSLLETITEYALNELYDEQEIKRKIMELTVLYELNEIGEEEYERLEKKLLAQLREARKYNMRKQREEEGEEEEEEEEAWDTVYELEAGNEDEPEENRATDEEAGKSKNEAEDNRNE